MIAIAAIVASLTVARQRQVDRRDTNPSDGQAPVALNLDGIRAAGW